MKDINEQKTKRLTGMILIGISIFMTFFILLWGINNPVGFIRYIGINHTALNIPYAWLLAVATAIGYIIYTARMIPSVRNNLFRFKSSLKWIAVYAAITGSIVEETVFRKLLMEWLDNNGFDTALQIAISGITFGIVHFSWGLFSGNHRIGTGSAISTMILGFLLALVYVVGDRNVLPAIAAHAIINLFAEPWLMLHAVSSAQGGRVEKR